MKLGITRDQAGPLIVAQFADATITLRDLEGWNFWKDTTIGAEIAAHHAWPDALRVLTKNSGPHVQTTSETPDPASATVQGQATELASDTAAERRRQWEQKADAVTGDLLHTMVEVLPALRHVPLSQRRGVPAVDLQTDGPRDNHRGAPQAPVNSPINAPNEPAIPLSLVFRAMDGDRAAYAEVEALRAKHDGVFTDTPAVQYANDHASEAGSRWSYEDQDTLKRWARKAQSLTKTLSLVAAGKRLGRSPFAVLCKLIELNTKREQRSVPLFTERSIKEIIAVWAMEDLGLVRPTVAKES